MENGVYFVRGNNVVTGKDPAIMQAEGATAAVAPRPRSARPATSPTILAGAIIH